MDGGMLVASSSRGDARPTATYKTPDVDMKGSGKGLGGGRSSQVRARGGGLVWYWKGNMISMGRDGGIDDQSIDWWIINFQLMKQKHTHGHVCVRSEGEKKIVRQTLLEGVCQGGKSVYGWVSEWEGKAPFTGGETEEEAAPLPLRNSSPPTPPFISLESMTIWFGPSSFFFLPSTKFLRTRKSRTFPGLLPLF